MRDFSSTLSPDAGPEKEEMLAVLRKIGSIGEIASSLRPRGAGWTKLVAFAVPTEGVEEDFL